MSQTPTRSFLDPGMLALYLLNRAACVVRRMAEDELAPYKLNPKHYGILAILHAKGPITQQSLGEFLHIDRTTIVQLVDELEALGAVVRGETPGDRRAYSLGVTASGESLLQQSSVKMAATQERFFNPLSMAERHELQRLLTKLTTDAGSPMSCSGRRSTSERNEG